MKIESFKPYVGQHCETTAIGCLLKHNGIALSEPMLFGLGEGLGFIFWKMKSMDFPFVGGRIKPDRLTENLCRNLNLGLEVRQTSSVDRAWRTVVEQLNNGIPVALKLDCFHLQYFTNRIHFAGHYAVIYGYDDTVAYLLDTEQQGGMVSTSLDSLAKARSAKGPMASKNLSYTIDGGVERLPELAQAVKSAIFNNTTDYLNPPIRNFGFKGIQKTAHELKRWFNTSSDPERDFVTTSMLMERAGTGGALFRNLYRDFLYEASAQDGLGQLDRPAKAFASIAVNWTELADVLQRAGETRNGRYIDSAVQLLSTLSVAELKAMTQLHELLA